MISQISFCWAGPEGERESDREKVNELRRTVDMEREREREADQVKEAAISDAGDGKRKGTSTQS